MDKEKLKVMIKDLKNVVNALESEIYSDTDVGILSSVVCFWFSSRAIEKMRK